MLSDILQIISNPTVMTFKTSLSLLNVQFPYKFPHKNYFLQNFHCEGKEGEKAQNQT